MNFCECLFVHQQRTPDLPALRYTRPDGELAAISYAQLFSRAGVYQRWMENAGLKAGDRVLLLMKPDVDFYVMFYAMLGSGIVPVLVESSMPARQLRSCLRQARLNAMLVSQGIGTKWFLLPELWFIRRFTFDSKRRFMAHLPDFLCKETATFHSVPVDDDAAALITFTSGSTGLPKGVRRSHNSLLAQSHAFSHFFHQTGQHDISTFPVLALFSHFHAGCSYPGLGFDTDGTIPAQRIAQQIHQHAITRLSVSPAWMTQLLNYAREQQAIFPSVKHLIIGGAPVNKALLLACLRHFPLAKCGVVYGATEADPISYIDMAELLNEWDKQPGYLVGTPGDNMEIIIRRLPCASPQEMVPERTEVEGEILVSGPQVLAGYLDNPFAEHQNKIRDSEGRIWHCTGDSGFLDAQQRIWLTGRIKDQLQTRSGLSVSPFTVEKHLNGLPGIDISAVVQGAQGEIGVVLQSAECCRIAAPLLEKIFPDEPVSFYVLSTFPVDARHHSRVDRAFLRQKVKLGKLKPIMLGEPL